MGLRDALRRLRRSAEPLMVSIEQPDGPPARFPESELGPAFAASMRRGCGERIPPHPLSLAAARSPDPEWSESFYADPGDDVPEAVDLSE